MYVCVSVCVWNPASVCLCQTEANPFAPAGCSQSIEDDFSFFPMWSRLRRYLNIPTFSAARALLRALRGLFPLPPSPSLLASVSLSLSLISCLSRAETHCLAWGQIHRHDDPLHTLSSPSYFIFARMFLSSAALNSGGAQLMSDIVGRLHRPLQHVLERGFFFVVFLNIAFGLGGGARHTLFAWSSLSSKNIMTLFPANRF